MVLVTTRVRPSPPSLRAYPNLPTTQEWKKDSAVGTWKQPRRSNDPALVRIDRMVKSLNSEKPKYTETYVYRLGGLFFTTMWWNNNYKFNPQKMDTRRRPMIMRLNLWAGNDLVKALKCEHIGNVAKTLKEAFGTEMSQHGIDVDSRNDGRGGEYRNTGGGLGGRQTFRIIFKDGLAYRFSEFGTFSPMDALTKLTTCNLDESGRDGEGYVMSMSNELYVYHFSGPVKYHSSFMAGKAVKCAGMIVIKEGVITKVRNDSGHYKPVDEALAQLIQHLKTVAVDISKITVEQEVKVQKEIDGLLKEQGWKREEFNQNRPLPFNSQDVNEEVYQATAVDFLRVNGNWRAITMKNR